MNLIHLNYKIDKAKYTKIFYDIHQRGEWYQWKQFDAKLSWWKVYLENDSDIRHLTKEVEQDLGIWGMETYPRFAYLFSNNNVPPHVDEDDMTCIQINLFDINPIIVVEDKEIPYECLLLENGKLQHWVDPVPYDRLMLKFCMRYPWEEVLSKIPKHLIESYEV
jgi:hypothetical protein|tara:strand:+ start:2118 stop:2609 length:492 start_codon:yes stop_codon:yes gene_type:complete